MLQKAKIAMKGLLKESLLRTQKRKRRDVEKASWTGTQIMGWLVWFLEPSWSSYLWHPAPHLLKGWVNKWMDGCLWVGSELNGTKDGAHLSAPTEGWVNKHECHYLTFKALHILAHSNLSYLISYSFQIQILYLTFWAPSCPVKTPQSFLILGLGSGISFC